MRETWISTVDFANVLVTAGWFYFFLSRRIMHFLNRWQHVRGVVLFFLVMETLTTRLPSLASLVWYGARSRLGSIDHAHAWWVLYLWLDWVLDALDPFLEFLLLFLIDCGFVNHLDISCIVLAFVQKLPFFPFLFFFEQFGLLIPFNNVLIYLRSQLFRVKKCVVYLSISLSFSFLSNMWNYLLTLLRELVQFFFENGTEFRLSLLLVLLFKFLSFQLLLLLKVFL